MDLIISDRTSRSSSFYTPRSSSFHTPLGIGSRLFLPRLFSPRFTMADSNIALPFLEMQEDHRSGARIANGSDRAEAKSTAPPADQSATPGGEASTNPKRFCIIAGHVTEKDIRAALVALLSNRDLDATTIEQIRAEVESKLGINPGGLDSRKAQVQTIV